MPRGGPRPNSGGPRPGAGRPRKNAAPVVKIEVEAVSAAITAGITPLEYMLGVMRDASADDARRDRMAQSAAPYCHLKASDVALGKKEKAQADADTAGVGTGWGNDLDSGDARLN